MLTIGADLHHELIASIEKFSWDDDDAVAKHVTLALRTATPESDAYAIDDQDWGNRHYEMLRSTLVDIVEEDWGNACRGRGIHLYETVIGCQIDALKDQL